DHKVDIGRQWSAQAIFERRHRAPRSCLWRPAVGTLRTRGSHGRHFPGGGRLAIAGSCAMTRGRLNRPSDQLFISATFTLPGGKAGVGIAGTLVDRTPGGNDFSATTRTRTPAGRAPFNIDAQLLC